MTERNNATSRFFIVALAAGFAVRMFIMATTYFSDILVIYDTPMIWIHHGHFNIYSHMADFGWNPDVASYYPPGLLYFSALFGKMIAVIMPGFPDWLQAIREGNMQGAMSDPSRFGYLFLMKAPYLLCDILLVRMLLRMWDRIPRNYVLLLWVLNPFAIHDAYVIGQFDVFIALLVTAAIYYYYMGRKGVVSTFLGYAAAVKVFPAIILFCQAVISGKTWTEKARLLAIGCLVPVLLTIPFLLGGDFTVMRSYFVYPGIGGTAGGGFGTFLVRMAPVLLVLAVLLARRKNFTDYLPDFTISLLFTFILTIRFEDRYALWAIAPLLIYAGRGGSRKFWVFALLICSALSMLTCYGDITTKVFAPLAGGKVSAVGLAEYCAAHGWFMPHKLFKLAVKICMIVLTLKIMFTASKSGGGGDRMKKLGMGCLGLALIIFVTIILLEGALWAIGRSKPSLVGLPEPDCFSTEPGIEYRYKADCKAGFFEINSAGFRDREVPVEKKPGTFRIACIGDSYTASTVVEFEHSYPKLLQDRLHESGNTDVEVLNMGVAGYDTVLAMQQYRKIGSRYNPDIVVLGIFLGNDIFDAKRDIYYDVFQGVLTTWPKDSAKRFKKKAALSSSIYRMYKMRKKRMVQDGRLDDTQQLINGFTEGYINYHLETVIGVFYDKSQETDFWRERWDAEFAQLAELNELVKSGGAELVIVIMPDEMQVNPEFLRTITETGGIDPQVVDIALPDKIIMDHCAEKGYHCLDLLPPILEHPEGGAALYEQNSGHWNDPGNQLAADVIADYVESNFDFSAD